MLQLTSQVIGAPLLTALVATGGQGEEPQPAAIAAASPSGTFSVVLSRPAPGEGAAHALIARKGEFVEWVEVETPRFPGAIFAGDNGVLHCVAGGPTAEPIVFGLDASGELLGSASLADLLKQPSATVDPSQVVASHDAGGRGQLAVPMNCGTVAFVNCGGASEDAIEYAICNAIPSPRHACGVRSWLTQARDLEREGDLAAARFALEAAVETAPEDPDVYVALARFEGRRGEQERRSTCLREAVHSLHQGADGAASEHWHVGTAEARLVVEYVACIQDAPGPGAALLAALDEVQGYYPCLDQLVLVRAACLLDDGRPDEARDAVDFVLQRLDPADDLAGAYGDVARFYERRGLLNEARAYYEDAYALGDRTEYLLRSLSKVSKGLGDLDRAARWLGILRDQWSAAITTDSNDRRRQRALDRLMTLEDEIEALKRP